jgi:hypothetical protein
MGDKSLYKKKKLEIDYFPKLGDYFFIISGLTIPLTPKKFNSFYNAKCSLEILNNILTEAPHILSRMNANHISTKDLQEALQQIKQTNEKGKNLISKTL